MQDDYQDQLVNAIYTGIKTYLGDELPQNRYRNGNSNSRLFLKMPLQYGINGQSALCTESSFFPLWTVPLYPQLLFVEVAESFTNVTFPLFPDATPEK